MLGRAGNASVLDRNARPQPRIDHQTMTAPFCNVTQYSNWGSAQSANGDGARHSNLAFTCLVEDAIVGSPVESQLSQGTPASLLREGGEQVDVALL